MSHAKSSVTAAAKDIIQIKTLSRVLVTMPSTVDMRHRAGFGLELVKPRFDKNHLELDQFCPFSGQIPDCSLLKTKTMMIEFDPTGLTQTKIRTEGNPSISFMSLALSACF